MRKFFLSILAFVLFIPSVAYAQMPADASILPVPPEKTANLFGQNHYYTVTLRGNGEAVVTFKAIFSNTGTTPLKTVSLLLPENMSPTDIIAYQVIREPQCIRYKPWPAVPKIPTIQPFIMEEQCAEYQQPDYQYLYGNVKYRRIQNETQNNTILLKLPTPIEPNKNGSYFVYYRTNAVAQKDVFGAYDYKFVTLQTEDKIHSLQVGIATDADYILKGVQSNVNYGGTVTMAALPAAEGMTGRSISNTQFDQFYNQIGSGTITKQASELAPKETYEVKGSYAKSQATLYGKEIATGVGIFLFIVIITIVAINIILRKVSGKKTEKTEEYVAQLKSRNKTFLIALSISFVSMLFLCLYTCAMYAITQLLNPAMYYGYSQSESILLLVVFAVSALVYLFFFFAPAVGVGIKKGMGWALVTFAATVVWAVLFLLVLFVGLFFLVPKNTGGGNMPYSLMNAVEGRAATGVDLAVPAAEPAITTDVTATTDEVAKPQTLELQPPKQETVETKTVETKISQ